MSPAGVRSVFSAGGPDAHKRKAFNTLLKANHSHQKGGIKEMKDNAWEETLSMEEKGRICPCCGDIYEVVHTGKKNQKYGYGYIRCLSCGMYTEV